MRLRSVGTISHAQFSTGIMPFHGSKSCILFYHMGLGLGRLGHDAGRGSSVVVLYSAHSLSQDVDERVSVVRNFSYDSGVYVVDGINWNSWHRTSSV